MSLLSFICLLLFVINYKLHLPFDMMLRKSQSEMQT